METRVSDRNKLFALRVRQLRKQSGITQEELGIALGITSDYPGAIISAWERQAREPSFNQIVALADYFGVSADYLLGREDGINQGPKAIPITKTTVKSPEPSKETPCKSVDVYCDGSIRTVKNAGKKSYHVGFAAWVSSNGRYWYDMVWAPTPNDAEMTALYVGLLWAIRQNYDLINMYTDDLSIISAINNGKTRQGIIAIKQLMEEYPGVIKIQHISREQNTTAHGLCDLAFAEYNLGFFPKKPNKNRDYRDLEIIANAIKRGVMRPILPILRG